jgi:hypothetical protein
MRITAIVERAVGLDGGRRGGPANAVVKAIERQWS